MATQTKEIGRAWICAACGNVTMECYRTRVSRCACGSETWTTPVKVYRQVAEKRSVRRGKGAL